MGEKGAFAPRAPGQIIETRKAEQGTLCPAFPPGSKPAGICPRRKAPEPAQTGLPPPEASTSAMRAFQPPGAALPCTPKRVISDKRRLSSHRSGGESRRWSCGQGGDLCSSGREPRLAASSFRSLPGGPGLQGLRQHLCLCLQAASPLPPLRHIGFRPVHLASFYLSHSLKLPCPPTVTFRGAGG